jgi:hypothetical protein
MGLFSRAVRVSKRGERINRVLQIRRYNLQTSKIRRPSETYLRRQLLLNSPCFREHSSTSSLVWAQKHRIRWSMVSAGCPSYSFAIETLNKPSSDCEVGRDCELWSGHLEPQGLGLTSSAAGDWKLRCPTLRMPGRNRSAGFS